MVSPAQLAEWVSGEWTRHPEESLAGVSHDTRTLKPGDVYVALRGENFDGHQFIPQALQAGAIAFLVDEAPASVGVPALVVEDTLVALQAWAAAHRRTMPATVIGITGSAGKTTVKELLASVLEEVGPVCRTPGNWNNHIGVPLSVLRLRPEHQFGVFEAGMNHPGELDPLFELIAPDFGILTVIGAAHAGAFADEAGIAREKASLARAIPENGALVIGDQADWQSLLQDACRGTILQAVVPDGAAEQGSLDLGSGALPIALQIPGRAMAENAVKVVAMARHLGVDDEAIRRGVASWSPAAMRWQVETIAGVTFINDAYNANPLSMGAALESFALTPVAGKRWMILGSMQELGAGAEAAHQALGQRVALGPWQGVVLVGEFRETVAAALSGAGFRGAVFCVASLEEAEAILRGALESGDAVLLKASRMDRLETVLALVRSRPDEKGVKL